MKKIILILLISLSSISFAIGQNARNISNIPLNAVNPIVAQHAQSSGISFTSNQSQYQLILGGRAILQNDNSVAAQLLVPLVIISGLIKKALLIFLLVLVVLVQIAL